MQVDYDAPEPPYKQVAAGIRERITSGELAAGRKIPSEQDIVKDTGVARSTARRAVEFLREQGLVFTVAGRGSYVRQRS